MERDTKPWRRLEESVALLSLPYLNLPYLTCSSAYRPLPYPTKTQYCPPPLPSTSTAPMCYWVLTHLSSSPSHYLPMVLPHLPFLFHPHSPTICIDSSVLSQYSSLVSSFHYLSLFLLLPVCSNPFRSLFPSMSFSPTCLLSLSSIQSLYLTYCLSLSAFPTA